MQRDIAELREEFSTHDAALERIAELEEMLRSATEEIVRLRDIISYHTKSAAGYVVSNIDVDVVSAMDGSGMRTQVRTSPRHYDFYLAEPISGYSSEHKRAFHQNVVRGFSEREADKIAASIWATGQ